jgi:hypothetical protein
MFPQLSCFRSLHITATAAHQYSFHGTRLNEGLDEHTHWHGSINQTAVTLAHKVATEAEALIAR